MYFTYVGPDLAVSIEPVLSPIILNMWASNVADPFVSIDALEVLEVVIERLFFDHRNLI